MFRQILTTLDGSEYAERALNYTRDLARIADAHVKLLMVVSATGPSNPTNDSRGRAALAYLEPEAIILREAGISEVETQVMFGEPAQLITEAAREQQADLIVMSTQGLGADGRYAVGSVALQVLMTAPCPVFLVRINKPEPPRTAAEERWQAEGGRNVG